MERSGYVFDTAALSVGDQKKTEDFRPMRHRDLAVPAANGFLARRQRFPALFQFPGAVPHELGGRGASSLDQRIGDQERLVDEIEESLDERVPVRCPRRAAASKRVED